MSSYTHDRRLLSLITPLGKDAVLVDGFTGKEAISSLTELELEVLSLPDNPINPPSLISQRVTLGIAYNNSGRRHFNGIVRSLTLVSHDVQMLETGETVLVYKMAVVPSMWLMTLNTQTRVFQNKTVIEIAREMLSDYGMLYEIITEGTYQSLDYCTQYRETDYDFLTRIMEVHGIFFYFTHTENDHKLVLADNSAALLPCPIQNIFNYSPQLAGQGVGGEFFDMYISSFAARCAFVTGKHTRWDYRFTQFARQMSSPVSSISRSETGANDHESYDYADSPSAFAKTDSSDSKLQVFESQLQSIARDRSDTGAVEAIGSSSASLLSAGFTFTLVKHPDVTQNIKHIVLSVEHTAKQLPPFRVETNDEPYINTFTAQPASVVYRPPLTKPKPRVHGVVTGKVVTPIGEDSYLDKYGRVCVQFWWDRIRPPNQTDNTLLRVAQTWAGSGWGTFFWPRIGDEVLVDFIEGDPDAPIVVGSLYNGVNKPKYNPATDYTRSGILTRSSKHGTSTNANELRFEDLAGSEQIYIHAERDYDVQVEHDQHTQIGNDQHVTVEANRYATLNGEVHRSVAKDQLESVNGDLHITVQGQELRRTQGNRNETVDGDSVLAVSGSAGINVSGALNNKVGGDCSLQVGANLYSKTSMSHVIEAEGQVHVNGAMSVVIESAMALCLKGVGGKITIDETGITLEGLSVKLDGLATPVPGVPANLESPGTPTLPTLPTAAVWPEGKAG